MLIQPSANASYSPQTETQQWPDGCVTEWEIIPSDNVEFTDNFLLGLEIITQNDIWAVGGYKVPNMNRNQTLIEHWDGIGWSLVPSPNQTNNNLLRSVAAVNSNDIWAVGSAITDSGQGQSIIEHWDGTQWSIITSPNPSPGQEELYSLEAVSTNDVWAVGYYSIPAQGILTTLIIHWDGIQWSIIPIQAPGDTNGLLDVEVISANDIWAVGGYAFDGISQTLTLHWNGVQWEQIPSPNVGTASSLRAISALSSNDIWAIGGSSIGTLTMHWDGNAWSVLPSPNVGTEGNTLYDVGIVTNSDVWAVGTYAEQSLTRTLTLHWNGTAWTVVPSPSPAHGHNRLYAVAVDPINTIWSVGTYIPFHADTFVLRYPSPNFCLTPTSTPNLSITPTPTNTRTRIPTSTPSPTRTPTNTLTGTPPTSTNTPTSTATPTGCAIQILLHEGFESGGLGAFTSTADPPAAPGWRPVTDYTQSGTYSAFVPDVTYTSRRYLTLSQPIHIPTGISHAILTFWHRYSFELPRFDCGYFNLSTDGWATWQDGSPYFISGGYNELNCWDDGFVQSGWGANTQGQYVPVQLDLTSFAGMDLAFRYEKRTDTSYAAEGWWIDDIELAIQFPACQTASPTPTSTSSATPTATPTATPSPSPTSSSTIPPTYTATSTSVSTSTPISTPIYSNTPTPLPSPTACTIEFTDVPPNSTFYPYIQCLACHAIINGYPDNTFRPSDPVSRGQIAKIVSNSAAFADPVSGQTFQDVPPAHTFYTYTERLATRAIMSGYPCGSPGEPCVAPDNRPYFRPASQATRAQLAKIVAKTIGYEDPPSGQTFEDVPVGSTFHLWIENLATRSIMSGYPCGGPNEPCNPPANLPYFRLNSNATRGQTSKIVTNTFFPTCLQSSQ